MKLTKELEIKCQLTGKIKDFHVMLHNTGYTKVGEADDQLNHYFINPADPIKSLTNVLLALKVSVKKTNEIIKAHSTNTNISIRTRYAGGQATLAIKSSNSDASNGDNRLETDIPIYKSFAAGLLSQKLDESLIDNGFQYLSKWSRTRQTYENRLSMPTVCLDYNSGYGYIVELEKVIPNTNPNQEEAEIMALRFIRQVASKLGLKELEKDKLNKMFDFYNKNWKEYYKTDKTFEIE